MNNLLDSVIMHRIDGLYLLLVSLYTTPHDSTELCKTLHNFVRLYTTL